MNISGIWIWLVAGVIPYYATRQFMDDKIILKAQALFWSLEVSYENSRRHQWIIHIPLIYHLKGAIWAAIMHIHSDKSPQK